MVKEVEHIDIDDVPDLVRFAEAVHASGTPRILSRGNEDLAMIVPLEEHPSATKRPRPAGRSKGPTTKDDPLWHLIGAGGAIGPTDIAHRKDEYIAEAYAAESAHEK
jgi:hypothetical protein